MRESVLLLLIQCCKSSQRPSALIPEEDETEHFIQREQSFPIMYERVTPLVFYSVSGAILVGLLLSTLFLANLIKFAEVLLIPLISLTTMILPNFLAIRYFGFKAERAALGFMSVISVTTVLQTLFAILDFH